MEQADAWQREDALREALRASQQRERELSAVLSGLQAVLEPRDFAVTARAIFDACKRLLGARAGYVALLTPDGAENEVVFLDAGGLSCTVDPELPMPIRGLRSEAYRTGRAVYDNEFAESQWMQYMPQGHVELRSVLFAPLVIQANAVGLLGLANKPGGFTDDDARIATAFSEMVSVALQNSWMLESLERSELQFRSVAESAADGIVVTGSQGAIVYANPAAAQMLGYHLDEMPQHLWSIIPPRVRHLHEPRLTKILSAGSSPYEGRAMEMSILRKDGGEVPAEVSVAAWRVGGEGFCTLILRNISGRRRAEARIRFQARMLDAVGQSVIGTDPQGVVIYWNREAEKLFGWSAQEALGRDVAEVAPTGASTEQAAKILAALAADESWTGEFRVGRRDGTTFPAIVSDAPVLDEAGRLVGVISVTTDITEQTQMAEEQARLIEQLQEAMDSIKVLRGLIPICAQCKKIRDDEGFWQQVDVYIRDHSEAQFTHGLCPDCVRELYPDFAHLISE